MKILVVGSDSNLEEFRKKFTSPNEYLFYNDYEFDTSELMSAEVIFDFFIGDNPEQFELYADLDSTVFISSPKISLSELAYYQEEIRCNLHGFNGLPTFLDRDQFEVSCLGDNMEQLASVCSALQTEYLIVDDRVGMVTPRIISMIINEAFYTLQEGTATVEDIDQGMKLGTNYPYGPFEWCEKIGVHNVYEVLEAIYEDTKDERYKICPLLKKEYLKKA